MVGLVLVAAVMHATWNAIVKVGEDRLVAITTAMAVSGALAPILIVAGRAPAVESWPYIALSVVVHTGYFVLLARTYRFGDLSHSYPLARGIAPVLVAGGAAAVGAERLSLAEIAAIGVISSGILSLAFAGRRHPGADSRATAYALATGGLIALYTVSDGLGVRAAGDPMGYIGWLFLFSPLPVIALVVVRRRPGVLAIAVRGFRPAAVGGVLSFAAYGLVIWALSLGPMAHVSALRETSVVVAALIGSRLLGEPFGVRRVLAAVTVALGVMALETVA